MRTKKLTILLTLSLLLIGLNTNSALAFFNTPVQTDTLYAMGEPVAKMGTTTEYGYDAPASDTTPYFYSALIASGRGVFGMLYYPELVRIEVDGTDPNGNPLLADRFGDLSVLLSPDDSGVEQVILKTIYDILIDSLPLDLKATLKNTISPGGATVGSEGEKAWGVWQRPPWEPSQWHEEKGLRFRYSLIVDPTLEGTYTINIHYHAWIVAYDGITLHHAGEIDLYDTVYYTYSTYIPRHDVAVTSVTASPTKLNIGESVTINVNTENQGGFTETFDVTAYYDSTAIGTQTVTLASGGSTTLTFTWDTTGMTWSQAGDYTIKAVASTVAGETDTADNTLVDGVVKVRIPGDGNFDGQVDMTDYDIWLEYYGTTPDQWPLGIDPDYDNNGIVDFDDFSIWRENAMFHDVAVTDVTLVLPYGATAVYPSWVIEVPVTVRNEGTYSETFTVTAYYDSTAIGTQTVTLAPSASWTLTFVWDTSDVSPGTAGLDYTISAEASVVPGETNTIDNTRVADDPLTVKYPGDVNGDGYVDGTDYWLFSGSYGTEYGEPGYNPDCDFDGDGEVNGRDYWILAGNWGHTP